MIDMSGRIIDDVHVICISNNDKTKFLTTYPKLCWTDNLDMASCFKDESEALEFEEQFAVQEFIGNELYWLVWTDTIKSIYDI